MNFIQWEIQSAIFVQLLEMNEADNIFFKTNPALQTFSVWELICYFYALQVDLIPIVEAFSSHLDSWE